MECVSSLHLGVNLNQVIRWDLLLPGKREKGGKKVSGTFSRAKPERGKPEHHISDLPASWLPPPPTGD
jgi:hypothetical protein